MALNKKGGGGIDYKRFSKTFEGLVKLCEEIQKRNQVSQEHNLFQSKTQKNNWLFMLEYMALNKRGGVNCF